MTTTPASTADLREKVPAAGGSPQGRARRRRRRPEEAEEEILAAAEAFLSERPFRELSVAELMERTGLARPSFYQYFRDRDELVVRLLGKLSHEILQLNRVWFEGAGDPVGNLRTGYEAIGRFWETRGKMLAAIAEAAAGNPKVEAAHRALVDRVIRGVAARIRRDMERGIVAPLDPDATAEALIRMSESFLNEKLGRKPYGDRSSAVRTLVTIWERTLYGDVR